MWPLALLKHTCLRECKESNDFLLFYVYAYFIFLIPLVFWLTASSKGMKRSVNVTYWRMFEAQNKILNVIIYYAAESLRLISRWHMLLPLLYGLQLRDQSHRSSTASISVVNWDMWWKDDLCVAELCYYLCTLLCSTYCHFSPKIIFLHPLIAIDFPCLEIACLA